MRTTLTIDDDLHARVQEAARQQRVSVRAFIEEALRRAVAPDEPRMRYEVRVHHSGLQPGIDARRLNQLADELEDDALVERMTR